MNSAPSSSAVHDARHALTSLAIYIPPPLPIPASKNKGKQVPQISCENQPSLYTLRPQWPVCALSVLRYDPIPPQPPPPQSKATNVANFLRRRDPSSGVSSGVLWCVVIILHQVKRRKVIHPLQHIFCAHSKRGL